MPNPPTVAGAVADLVFTSLRSLLTFSPLQVRRTIKHLLILRSVLVNTLKLIFAR